MNELLECVRCHKPVPVNEDGVAVRDDEGVIRDDDGRGWLWDDNGSPICPGCYTAADEISTIDRLRSDAVLLSTFGDPESEALAVQMFSWLEKREELLSRRPELDPGAWAKQMRQDASEQEGNDA
jgi:hypothetical protein